MTAEELGGALVHTTRSSIADRAYENDVEALLQMRRLIDFLPPATSSGPPPAERSTTPTTASLARYAHARQPEQALRRERADPESCGRGRLFRDPAAHAKNIVTGFARIERQTVGMVANQPLALAGVLDIDASRKAARFVRFCDCFNIPIVTFVDVPGFLPGTAQEYGGMIKHGAKLLFAYAEATVPKVTVITRKAFGGAYDVMASKHLRGDVNLAGRPRRSPSWEPRARWRSFSRQTSTMRQDRGKHKRIRGRVPVALRRGRAWLYRRGDHAAHDAQAHLRARSPCCARRSSRTPGRSTTTFRCEASAWRSATH